ncbi:MAG: hypothetical protein GX326_01980 [Clostridiaceae bacterium]|nr:hypothetical protein [Clostridiaceae bacterium]
MSNQVILEKFNLAIEYMTLLAEYNYKLIDLNMIEPFRIEDKEFQPSSLVFERNETMYAIRSDWTRSLLNYNDSYFLDDRMFCYFGTVIRDYQSFYQAGVELYEPSEVEMLKSIQIHLDFVKNKIRNQGKNITALILNNDRFIDLFIEKYDLSESIRTLIYEKNLSELKNQLEPDNPLLKILQARVSEQYTLLASEFSNTEELQTIEKIKKIADQENLKFMIDLSFKSPQGYYNGLYFQAFINYHTPILSGGEYDNRAFGIALNIEDGGLL